MLSKHYCCTVHQLRSSHCQSANQPVRQPAPFPSWYGAAKTSSTTTAGFSRVMFATSLGETTMLAPAPRRVRVSVGPVHVRSEPLHIRQTKISGSIDSLHHPLGVLEIFLAARVAMFVCACATTFRCERLVRVVWFVQSSSTSNTHASGEQGFILNGIGPMFWYT